MRAALDAVRARTFDTADAYGAGDELLATGAQGANETFIAALASTSSGCATGC